MLLLNDQGVGAITQMELVSWGQKAGRNLIECILPLRTVVHTFALADAGGDDSPKKCTSYQLSVLQQGLSSMLV